MNNIYKNPLEGRYSSAKMLEILSEEKKIQTWRKLWTVLAEAQKSLGLDISDEQTDDMRAHIQDIDFASASEYEKKFRHDVMAHIHTFGDAAQSAKGIIHLGATSAFVGDNADIIIFDEALRLIKKELINLIYVLSDFAERTKDIPALGFTHLQPAQLTTVGKRACLWLTDLMLDYEELEFVLSGVRLRGAKGTTGTQASYLELFGGDEEKVRELNRQVVARMGYERDFPLTSQTYPRKFDTRILNVLSSIAQSLHKFGTDLRLLQSMKEIEEPFSASQIGSSAMPYKRNPMKAERICSLSRYIIVQAINPALTASVQWLERSLDDSANRRLSVPESFLAADAALNIAYDVVSGLCVNEKVIHSNIMKELPFMATENILMRAVKNGGDRQLLHEKIRVYSLKASDAVKNEGKPNPLLSLIAEDKDFGLSSDELGEIQIPSLYTGRSSSLVSEYLDEYVKPVIDKNRGLLGTDYTLKV